ncbi:MAG: cell division protein ZapD [Xanthomonadaceae bacterium]|nr:cell division protein ZapD [Xanthomonadaceae bacterium]
MIYEYPLSEGARRLLRIEMLVDQARNCIELDSPYATLAAIRTLLDTVGLVTKNDLKVSILRVLDEFSFNENLTDEVKEHAKTLKTELTMQSVRAYDEIKENAFLNILRQRIHIPGGTCGFDVPLLHNWLERPHEVRKDHFYRWFSALDKMVGTIEFTLQTIRSLKREEHCQFKRGFYYSSIKWDAALVRLEIDDPNIYPEFSGNRHQLSVRLFHQEFPWERATQIPDDCQYVVEICGE